MRIAEAAYEKKARDVLVLDLRKLDAVTDFFVLCTGDAEQQVRAIVEHIEERVEQTLADRVLHREGMEALNWVLLDYVDVVVHVFRPSFREFYRLEDLWSDAERLSLNEQGKVVRSAAAKKRRVLAGTQATGTDSGSVSVKEKLRAPRKGHATSARARGSATRRRGKARR